MNDTNALGWIMLALPGLAAVFCFAAAFSLVGLIRLNKGAKLNRAWGLLAFGSACLGLAALDRTIDLLGLPNAAAARDALSALGSLLILSGAVYGRGLYRNLLK